VEADAVAVDTVAADMVVVDTEAAAAEDTEAAAPGVTEAAAVEDTDIDQWSLSDQNSLLYNPPSSSGVAISVTKSIPYIYIRR